MADDNDQGTTSSEDKFFGVRTTIQRPEPDNGEGEQDKLEIEEVGDQPPPQRPVGKKDLDDEIPDEHREEIESYAKKMAQKRINELTHKQREAERMRDEAVRAAEQLAQKNKQYESVLRDGEGALLRQAKERAQLALDKAKTDYRQAYEEGDTDKIVESQEKLSQASAELREVQNRENQVQSRQQPQQPQQPEQPAPQQDFDDSRSQQPPQQPQPQLSERQQNWNEQNPWFMNDNNPAMTAFAFGVHEELKREGVELESDDYYARIDQEMRDKFPDYFGGDGKPAAERKPASEPTQPPRRSAVAPPGDRSNAGSPRKVQLTATQVALAKKLGLTPEQYARELVKGEGNG